MILIIMKLMNNINVKNIVIVIMINNNINNNECVMNTMKMMIIMMY